MKFHRLKTMAAPAVAIQALTLDVLLYVVLASPGNALINPPVPVAAQVRR